MRKLPLFFIGIFGAVNAQSPILGFDRPNVVFTGFNNVLGIGTSNGRPFIPEAVGCKLTANEDGSYILNPENSKEAKVILKDAQTLIPFDTLRFTVCPLPSPELFFGASISGERAHRSANVFYAKYGPDIPLSINHEIKSLEIFIGDTVYFISGNSLTEEVHKDLKKQPSGSTIQCIANVKNPNGFIYKISGKWKLI